jgi:D-3-phosphoglycerate dehydrogenase
MPRSARKRWGGPLPNPAKPVFSEEAVNSAAQYLRTDAKVGYVVIDVEKDERAETVSIRRQLEWVPGTIRRRILS